jgi:hypothetical protein
LDFRAEAILSQLGGRKNHLYSPERFVKSGTLCPVPAAIRSSTPYLNPALYARYQLRFEAQPRIAQVNTFPCFRHEKVNKAEVLWGATYRITAAFLNYVFGFAPPDLNSLPEIHGSLSKAYLPKDPLSAK